MAVVERVERVEKFLLRTFLARKKLDIVNQKNVSLTVFLAEFDERSVLDGINELICKLFTGKVNDLCRFIGCLDMVADRVEQMGLAQSAHAINEKRVVGRRRRLRHCQSSRVSELAV